VKLANGNPAGTYVIKEYATTWSDKTAARNAVRFEQRLEFAMEGHRFFDLVRWGIADQVINDYLTVEQNRRVYLKGAKFVKGKHEYFPIPAQEILNSAIGGTPTLVQNPGY
jgi:hypothetical protein